MVYFWVLNLLGIGENMFGYIRYFCFCLLGVNLKFVVLLFLVSVMKICLILNVVCLKCGDLMVLLRLRVRLVNFCMVIILEFVKSLMEVLDVYCR